MDITSPLLILSFGLAEILTVTSPQSHPLTDTSDLEVWGTSDTSIKYATFEPDTWILDGSVHILEDIPHIGFVSEEVSDASGNFSTGPRTQITLNSVVDIEEGVTIHFSKITGNYSNSINVAYYDNTFTLIGSSYNYAPDDYSYFAELPSPVVGVKYIDINYIETETPYRHARVENLNIDGVVFDSELIESASIIEEIDPVGLTTPIDKLNFSLHSEDGEFSIVDPQGPYAGIEFYQSVDAYEYVNSNPFYMGRFYTKDWGSINENLAEFECVDALYLLEKETTYGRWFRAVTAWTAEEVMDCIMGNVFCAKAPPSQFDYEIDASLASELIVGWLPIMNRREALQQLAFAVGGYVDCSRSEKVEIKPLRLIDDISTFDFDFSADDYAERPDVKLNPIVTGIRITAHTFVDQEPAYGQPVIYDDDVPIGEITIYPQNEDKLFGTINSDPVNYPSTAEIDDGFGGTTTFMTDNKANYATFDIVTAGRLVLIDNKVNIHNRKEYFLENTGIPSGTPDNIIVIENATLVNNDNVEDIAQRVLDYYNQRYSIEVELFAEETAVGDSAKIDTQSSKELWGIAEQMDIDLSGGFLQKSRFYGEIH